MNFKNWLIIEDSNFRKLIELLRFNGFYYQEPGKGDHQIWVKDGYKVSVDPSNVRNPNELFKQTFKQWHKNKEFKHIQMLKRKVA